MQRKSCIQGLSLRGGGGSYQEIISRVRDRRSTGVRARGVKIALRGDKSVGTMFIEL